MSERKHLHIELGISDERMNQMREQVIEQIRKLRDEEDDDKEDVTFYSQIVMNCSQVPNDMEEAILIGMVMGRTLMSYELSKIPIIGDLALAVINQKM